MIMIIISIDGEISPFSLIGLVVIALGTGGIKPCVSAFGGDQFARPQQNKQLEQFFSIFYFAINAGSLISTFLTPILREDVECFGQSTCFPLAFGVPAILMVVAVGNFDSLFGMLGRIRSWWSVWKILLRILSGRNGFVCARARACVWLVFTYLFEFVWIEWQLFLLAANGCTRFTRQRETWWSTSPDALR